MENRILLFFKPNIETIRPMAFYFLIDEWQGDEVINHLHRCPCLRENPGVQAGLCLPSLPARQGVQSDRSDLDDPVGHKQTRVVRTGTIEILTVKTR